MTQCYICSQELINIEIDARDNKIKPCHVCLQIVQDCVEQMANRDKRKKQMLLWHNEVTGEYSLGEEDIERLEGDEDIDEFLDGFHLVDDDYEQNYD